MDTIFVYFQSLIMNAQNLPIPLLFKMTFVLMLCVSLKAAAQNDILDHKNKILIQKIHTVNSPSRETNLSISPDGKYMYFLSDRGGQLWSGYSGTYNGMPRYDGDIWFSTNVNGAWQKPVCLGMGVNTYSGEDEPMISPDGQFVVFQSWRDNWKESGGPYYRAELNDGRFTNSKGLGGGINSFLLTSFIRSGGTFATDGAAMSPDGKTFLLCCGPNYDGNLDIYISRKVNGVWTYMKKLPISTPGDERSVFIAGDGKTVYFGSDGYKGYGGLDVYKTSLNDDGTCGKVINVGAPFNTSEDDYGFITTASGNESYFVREGDIYFANTEEADPNLKPEISVIISGTIKNQNGKAVQLYLELEDGTTKEIISNSKSDSQSGEFLFSTSDLSGNYIIRDELHKLVDTTFSVVIKDGVAKYHVDIVIKETNTETSEHTKSVVVNFEHDRDILDAVDLNTLNEIVALTYSSVNYDITIVGHTDSHGSADYNKKLGLERAASMKKYLVEKGVNANKIRLSSFGETKLLEADIHRAAAERNRRAELIITYEN
jgi:outer membrane protein OmpA-like peptidoglycan-associated protein